MPNDAYRKRLVDLAEAGGLYCSVEAEVHVASLCIRLAAVHSVLVRTTSSCWQLRYQYHIMKKLKEPAPVVSMWLHITFKGERRGEGEDLQHSMNARRC